MAVIVFIIRVLRFRLPFLYMSPSYFILFQSPLFLMLSKLILINLDAISYILLVFLIRKIKQFRLAYNNSIDKQMYKK